MRVTLTTTTATLVIGDDAADQYIRIGNGEVGSQLQTAAPFRGSQVTHYARGNVAGRVSISVTEEHDNLGAATLKILDELKRVNSAGTLDILYGVARARFAGVVLQSIAWQLVGVTTVISYQFATAQVT